MGAPIEREAVLEHETKNAFRMMEDNPGNPPIFGRMYLQKWPFKMPPKRVRVTIEVLEPAE